ncbi:MAG: hypothetical protein IPJ17_12800 [Holophagales bacterium]|nr:MAG: hypothetical protein IPJ17_12800 [Holophagales bacterium]
MPREVVIGLNAVIVAVTDEAPRLLAVREPGHRLGGRDGEWSLPFGPLEPDADRTLELALRGWVRAQTGLGLGYVEQLYTFGNRDRDPAERAGGPRVISIAYLALVREAPPSGAAGASWLDVYDFLPWEDWRDGRPSVIEESIAPALDRWVEAVPAERSQRRERADIAFGLGGAPWNGERVLDRYELLYEVEKVAEAKRDRTGETTLRRGKAGGEATLGRAMALDHRRILASALGRLRGKLRYRPVVFETLSSAFTLSRLQRTVEALAGVRLHKQNFRRLVEQGGLVEGTGQVETRTGGRPAGLFRFRRDVLRERPAPGVGLPGTRHPG